MFEALPAAFSGTVLSFAESNDPSFKGMLATIQVEQAWKGVRAGQVVTVATGYEGIDCGVSFKRDSVYVVFGSRTRNGWVTTSLCDDTIALRKNVAIVDSLATWAQLSPAEPKVRDSTATYLDPLQDRLSKCSHILVGKVLKRARDVETKGQLAKRDGSVASITIKRPLWLVQVERSWKGAKRGSKVEVAYFESRFEEGREYLIYVKPSSLGIGEADDQWTRPANESAAEIRALNSRKP